MKTLGDFCLRNLGIERLLYLSVISCNTFQREEKEFRELKMQDKVSSFECSKNGNFSINERIQFVENGEKTFTIFTVLFATWNLAE